MGFLDLFKREERAETVTSSDPYLAEFFGQRTGPAGANVTPDRTGGLAVAYRCIQARAEGLASVPLKLYRRLPDGGREAAPDHPLYRVLAESFTDGQTAFEGRELLSAWADLYGNTFARIETNARGQVTALHPLAPGTVTVELLSSGRLRYRHTPETGGEEILLADEVLHVRHRGRDGRMGIAPAAWARENVSLALAQQDQAGAMVRNGMRLSGALTFDQNLNDEQFERIRKSAEGKFTGADNAGKFLILEAGAGFTPFSMPAKDAEFLESRKLSNLDIARLYGVPPTVAGIPDHATYSNVEGESKALVARCLLPWARRIEAAMNAALLTPMQRRTFFIEHDLTGLLRADTKARYDAYRVALEWGFMNANEVRRAENLSKIPGGDEFMSPLNMRRGEDETAGEDE